MKIRLLKECDIEEVGAEIVDAKRFKDFTPEEVANETDFPASWRDDDVFAKRMESHLDGTNYLYMSEDERVIINE